MNLETFLDKIKMRLDDDELFEGSPLSFKNLHLEIDALNLYDGIGFIESDKYAEEELNTEDDEYLDLPILREVFINKGQILKPVEQSIQCLPKPDVPNKNTKVEETQKDSEHDEIKASIRLLEIRKQTFKKFEDQLDVRIKEYKAANLSRPVEFEQIYVDYYQACDLFDEEHNVLTYFPKLAKLNIKSLKQHKKDLEKAIKQQAHELPKLCKTASVSTINRKTTSVSVNNNMLNIEKYFDDFIGLQSVKSELKKLVAFLAVQEARSKQGFTLKNPPTKHMVFTGNPGTGKTEMARLVAKIFYDVGIIKEDIFIEADRSDLIGEYLGETAAKTKALIESALGGVLFVDEAYSLKTRHDDMYGDEAIATLLKMMEDNRSNLTVIVAGYEEEMEGFLETNPGLRSRFNRYIDFPNYSPSELFEILLKMCKGNHYQIEKVELLSTVVPNYFKKIMNQSDRGFANARFVRNYFESLIESHSLRVVSEPNQDINLLKVEDFVI